MFHVLSLLTLIILCKSKNCFVFANISHCVNKCHCFNNTLDCSKTLENMLPNLSKVNFIFINFDLSYNNIDYIDSEYFHSSNCKNLESLDLSHNKLSYLYKGLLENLINLRILNLANNYLQQIDDNFFINQFNLEELDLSYNPINGKYLFLKNLPNLRSLNLAKTDIHVLDPFIFSYNYYLEYIDLSNNKFTEVPIKALGHIANSLDTLILDKNPIMIINFNSFAHLSNLKTLTLNYMPLLKSIKELSFFFLTGLQHLEITYCSELIHLDPNAFFGLRSNNTIQHFAFNNNRLTTLHQSSLNWCSIPYINLMNNNWKCDCKLRWLKDECHKKEFESIICSSPPSLKDIQFGVLTVDQLKCAQDSHDTKILRLSVLLFGIFVLFLIGLLIGIIVQKLNLVKWIRVKTDEPSYYIRLSKRTDE